jgi:hypothetical protein
VAAVWGLSSVRRATQRLTPERMSGELAGAVRDRGRAFGADLRGAVAEGREAMVEREHELRAALRGERGRRGVAPATGTGSSTAVR